MNESQRTELTRAIAESDIAGCSLENKDIDALVDLFEAWLERAAAPLPVETLGDDDTAICPNPSCHKAFSNDMLRDDKRIPTHDFPEPCRSVCPGSGQWPANYAGAKIDALPVDTQGAFDAQVALEKLNAWTNPDQVLSPFTGTCIACGITENYTYHVPESLWRKVIPAKWWNEIICAKCFHGFINPAATQPAWQPSEHTENGLRLLRSIICGGNALRDFDVFSCNESGHELHCKCFWAQCDEWEKADLPLPAPPAQQANDFCYAKGDEGSRHCGSPKATHCSVLGDEAFWTSPEGRTHLIACVGDRHLIHHRFVPATPASGEPHEFLEQPRGKFPRPENAIGKCWEVVNMVYCGQPRDAEVHVQPASREDER